MQIYVCSSVCVLLRPDGGGCFSLSDAVFRLNATLLDQGLGTYLLSRSAYIAECRGRSAKFSELCFMMKNPTKYTCSFIIIRKSNWMLGTKILKWVI